MSKIRKVMIGTVMLAFFFAGYFLSPKPTPRGVGVVQSVAKAPVVPTSIKLSPTNGARPSSSSKGMVANEEDKLLKFNPEATFDVK